MAASLSKKVVIIQYWNGDRDAALRLGRFISDLERLQNNTVDIAFAVRADSEMPDAVTLKRVARKFNVTSFKAPRLAVGWPAGPWVLWFSAVEWLLKQQEVRVAPYKWAMTIEADCVPMRPTWLAELDAEWDRNQPGTRMLGAAPLGGVSHINGNCLISGESDWLDWIVHTVTVAAVPPPEGWDTFLFSEFLQWGCTHTDKVFSQWHTPSIGAGSFKRWLSQGICLFHGVKDDSLLRQCRSHWLKNGIQP